MTSVHRKRSPTPKITCAVEDCQSLTDDFYYVRASFGPLLKYNKQKICAECYETLLRRSSHQDGSHLIRDPRGVRRLKHTNKDS